MGKLVSHSSFRCGWYILYRVDLFARHGQRDSAAPKTTATNEKKLMRFLENYRCIDKQNNFITFGGLKRNIECSQTGQAGIDYAVGP